MTTLEKIKAEIERLKEELLSKKKTCKRSGLVRIVQQLGAYNKVLNIIDLFSQKSVTSVWHNSSQVPDVGRNFLLVSPNGNSSLCIYDGKEIISHSLGGGHPEIFDGDKWSYVDDLVNNQEQPIDNGLNENKDLAYKIAEKFARVIRANLCDISTPLHDKIKTVYEEVTNTKMYGGYND